MHEMSPGIDLRCFAPDRDALYVARRGRVPLRLSASARWRPAACPRLCADPSTRRPLQRERARLVRQRPHRVRAVCPSRDADRAGRESRLAGAARLRRPILRSGWPWDAVVSGMRYTLRRLSFCRRASSSMSRRYVPLDSALRDYARTEFPVGPPVSTGGDRTDGADPQRLAYEPGLPMSAHRWPRCSGNDAACARTSRT